MCLVTVSKFGAEPYQNLVLLYMFSGTEQEKKFTLEMSWDYSTMG